MEITGHWCSGRLWDLSVGAVLADWWYCDLKCSPGFTVVCGNLLRSEFHPEDLSVVFFLSMDEAG